MQLINWLKGKIRAQALIEGPFTLADPTLVRSMIGLVTAAGKPVTRDTAIRCASFFSGVKMLANDVAKMPLVLFASETIKGRQRTVKATQDPLYPLLKNFPNRWMTAFQHHWIQIFHLFFAGSFYTQKIEDSTGRILQLMPLSPWHMKKRWETKGQPQLFFDYDDGTTKRTFTQDEIWWNSILNCYGPVDGMSILAIAKEALSVMMASDEIAGKFFANGMFASGFVTADKDAEVDSVEAQNLVDKLARFYAGSGNAGKFTFMPYGAKFEKMVFTPEETQLLESRKWNAEEVVRLLGGAPLLVKLGYGEKNSTYAASSAFMEEYFNTSLMPITVNNEQSILRDLIAPEDQGRLYAKYNADVALRGDIKSRYESYAIGIDKGFLRPNDALAMEDLDTMEGLDYYHINQNAILIDGEILTVGVRPADAGSVEPPPQKEPPDRPAPAQPPATPQNLLRVVMAAAERVLRKEEREGSPNAKFVMETLAISAEDAEKYVAQRPQLNREQARVLLMRLATGEQQ